MPKFIKYEHHGKDVFVREDLKGRHKEHCLCYSCAHFIPDTEHNCPAAQQLFEYDVLFKMTTPVWECPIFKEK